MDIERVGRKTSPEKDFVETSYEERLTDIRGEKRLCYITVRANTNGGNISLSSVEHDDIRFPSFETLKNTGRAFKLSLDRTSVEGKFAVEEFSIEREGREFGIEGKVEKSEEFGVFNVRVDLQRKDGAKVWLAYDGEVQEGFPFWGIAATMPLKFDPYSRPEVHFRPRFGTQLLYIGPSISKHLTLFTAGWELNYDEKEGPSGLYTVRHESGHVETVELKLEEEQEWKKLLVKRHMPDYVQVMEKVGMAGIAEMFSPTQLTVNFASVFPRSLTEIGGLTGLVNDTEAEILIGKQRELVNFCERVLPVEALQE